MNDFICFGLFNPFEGIHYALYFNGASFVAGIFEMILNYIFMTPANFLNVFWLFLITGIFMFIFVAKNIPLKIKKYSNEKLLN